MTQYRYMGRRRPRDVSRRMAAAFRVQGHDLVSDFMPHIAQVHGVDTADLGQPRFTHVDPDGFHCYEVDLPPVGGR